MSNYVFNNSVSSIPFNPNVAHNNSWITVGNNAGRELYAQASYITNFDGLSVTLSAGNLDIGEVHVTDKGSGLAVSVIPDGAGIGAMRTSTEIKDANSDLYVTIADIGGGQGAMRVLSQDLESLHDAVGIGDLSGNRVSVTNSALNVFTTNTINAITTPSPTQLDAFGRLRVSTPFTLFDSSNRYRDNNLFATLTAVGGTYNFNASQGLVDLTVNQSSGSSVIRETTKTFSYQPGKSLLVLNTFVMASSATNLRQRVGYFGSDNGIYLQLDDGNISFVERSSVSGVTSNNVIPLSAWNGDKLNGNGPSGLTLDITKAQIFWMDIEWLGVGSVRVGFVIDGQYVICHTFHHANINYYCFITNKI